MLAEPQNAKYPFQWRHKKQSYAEKQNQPKTR